jgi:hypothetical protein
MKNIKNSSENRKYSRETDSAQLCAILRIFAFSPLHDHSRRNPK